MFKTYRKFTAVVLTSSMLIADTTVILSASSAEAAQVIYNLIQ